MLYKQWLPARSHYASGRLVSAGVVRLFTSTCGIADSIAVAIERVLNLNHDPTQSSELDGEPHGDGLVSHSSPILNEDGDPIWKVLVFDNLGRDVISSVLRVNDLRSWGITIHLYVYMLSARCALELC